MLATACFDVYEQLSMQSATMWSAAACRRASRTKRESKLPHST